MNERLEQLLEVKVPDIGFRTMMVGGVVRDALLGVESKDFDFSVEAPSFAAMVEAVEAECEVFVTTPETFTVRAKGREKGAKTLDFVLCRKDGPSSDSRRPDFVEAGTFLDDMLRRDFTVNAMGLNMQTGELFDPTGGMADLENRVLRFVGDPFARISEDALRVVRALRFTVTKGFTMSVGTWDAVGSPTAANLVCTLPVERIRPELEKMLLADTLATLELLGRLPNLQPAMFRDGLRLGATMRAKPVAE